MARFAPILLAAASLVACTHGGPGTTDAGPPDEGGDPDVTIRPPDSGHGPTMQVGTGGTTFIAIADGGDVELVHGPQGGYHILLSSKFRGLEPDGLALTYVIRRAGSDTQLNFQTVVHLRRGTVTPDRDGGWLRTGDLGVLMVTGPADVVGSDVRIEGEAVASDGLMASDSRLAHVVDNE